MNDLVVSFCRSHALSERESQVVKGLVWETTVTRDLAGKLTISTNTLNNHLKSIFTKTRAESKSEVLRMFIGFAAEQTTKTRPEAAFVAVMQDGEDARVSA